MISAALCDLFHRVHVCFFRLKEEDLESNALIPLKFVKFQNVQNVTVSLFLLVKYSTTVFKV